MYMYMLYRVSCVNNLSATAANQPVREFQCSGENEARYTLEHRKLSANLNMLALERICRRA